MRFHSLVCLLLTVNGAAAFVPSVSRQPHRVFYSTVEADTDVGVTSENVANGAASPAVTLSAADVNARLQAQLEKLREKDATSAKLSKEDIKVVFEDDHVIVVNKPAGVLSVSSEHPSLAQAVFENFGASLDKADKMVVHRLGFDTSGLVVLAKTVEAVRGMNTVFRSRKIERTYEALVCGHMEQDSGIIHLPLMRDYEFPPFMRVSTEAHQQALLSLEGTDVSKKLLQLPKDSLTKYQVIGKEEVDGQPVTRVLLHSISGRTHQLNVHLAALGHPIVGDATYGKGGSAAPNGGLTLAEQDKMLPNKSRASDDVQSALASKTTCVHAKSLKFRHPVTKEDVSLSVDAPF